MANGKGPESRGFEPPHLSVLDPFVRGFSKNGAAGVLKARKAEVVSEAFISANARLP